MGCMVGERERPLVGAERTFVTVRFWAHSGPLLQLPRRTNTTKSTNTRMEFKMGNVKQTKAALRLVGQDLVPDEVSEQLGRKPDLAYRKGDPFFLNNGQLGAPRSTGFWSIAADPRHSGDLDLQIIELLASVSEDPVAWRQLTAIYAVDLFCGLFIEDGNEGLSLQPSTLAALGVRGISLGLDIYAIVD